MDHFAMKNQQALISLLQENGRRSVSDLAKQLGLSRATVQQAMERLERTGVIQGYTVKINPDYQQRRVSAYIMISVVSQKTTKIVQQIHKHPQLDMLCTISGQYDLMAMVTESTTEALDIAIDSIAALDGVEKTLSHIVLSRKKDRAI
jgi:DNA-binding Lrp family transcriptional regulator|tara:strand:+ start:682 stop:1125 length:444 start_codon:yes stop_codon:yes gene_type:complete